MIVLSGVVSMDFSYLCNVIIDELMFMKDRCLVINPIGGLANRMRAIASGVSLANAIEADIRIVWAKNRELNAYYEDIFEVPQCLKGKFVYPSLLIYDLMYSMPRKRNCYFSSLTLKRYGRTLLGGTVCGNSLITGADAQNAVKCFMETGFERRHCCYLQGGTDMFPYSAALYRGLFLPKTEILEEVHKITKLLGGERVGLHIRRTDNIESIRNSPDVLFTKKVESILAEKPSTKFYLATDCDATKESFLRMFGDCIICSPRSASRTTVAGIRDAVIELWVLSQTNRIIGSYYSSFSEAAALLGDIPLTQVKVKGNLRQNC